MQVDSVADFMRSPGNLNIHTASGRQCLLLIAASALFIALLPKNTVDRDREEIGYRVPFVTSTSVVAAFLAWLESGCWMRPRGTLQVPTIIGLLIVTGFLTSILAFMLIAQIET